MFNDLIYTLCTKTYHCMRTLSQTMYYIVRMYTLVIPNDSTKSYQCVHAFHQIGSERNGASVCFVINIVDNVFSAGEDIRSELNKWLQT